MNGRPIERNAMRCLTCEDEIESVHRTDYQQCSCGDIWVDGGTTFLRRGHREGAEFLELSTYKPSGSTG